MHGTTFNWHLLDARAIWVKELAGALAEQVSLLSWLPDIRWDALLRGHGERSQLENPRLIVQEFPLQRGFARWPFRYLVNEGKRIASRLRHFTSNESRTVLLCASPHYASVAEQWQGPVIYYMSDLYYAWGEDPAYVNYHDRRMCQRATLVCPVSERGKAYLVKKAGCPVGKIAILPMATRESNILPQPQLTPAKLPDDIVDLPRPTIGIIGNLARNTDWLLLQQVVASCPAYSWVFVGPTDMPVPDHDHEQARMKLQQSMGRVRFVGSKPYHELADYARSFDAAVLPYRKIEPTYSGSSTRFYEHQAACRPMLATHGFAELLTKEPLVHLVENAEVMIDQLHQLALQGFVDGQENNRWQASHADTWTARASSMRQALADRLNS